MRIRILILITLLYFGFAFHSPAQQYHSTSKKAIKHFNAALSYFDAMNDELALEFINKAINADKNFVEAYMMKSQILKDRMDVEGAIQNFQKALKLDPSFQPQGYMILAEVQFNAGKYEDALKSLNTFISNGKFQKLTLAKAEEFKLKIEYAINAVDNPVEFNPLNLGASINSEYNEYWPSLTLDESKIIFTVMVPKDIFQEANMNNVQEDFYISIKNDSGWWNPRESAGSPPNTERNEGAQSFSADGRFLFFTACNRMEGFGKCDIYYSVFTGSRWGNAINLGSAVNTKHSDKHPSISSDNKTLYFASDRPGGFGGLDIWYAEKDESGKWKMAKNMGDSINTPGNEQSPFIHPDNQTLYFSSEGHNNLGSGDIFLSRRNSEDKWGKAQNLGYPINTHNNEIGLIVNPQGTSAFFSSDRIEGKGMDIYSFELPEETRPIFVSYMKGRVYDANSYKGISAKFQLIDLETGRISIESKSNFGEGDFLVPLPTNKNFALNVSHPGYLFYSDHFEFAGIHKKSDPFLMDVPLKRIKKGESIVLNNIFFEFDSHELLKESKIELDKIFEFLNLNPLINIEISGHTDNVGSNEYNQNLSENRAEAVINYLLSDGINKGRLISKGYGSMMPVVPNNSDENRAKNRRTELKIL
ncbi:MAG: PD40 domain-containing protein [Bacteroidales bacterium]|nr:PD40 domain-containing protein [Bacteroidales bacterium]